MGCERRRAVLKPRQRESGVVVCKGRRMRKRKGEAIAVGVESTATSFLLL